MALGAFFATTLGKVVIGLLIAVPVGGIVGGIGAYASDYGVEAVVKDVHCSLAGSTLTVEEQFLGFDHKQGIDYAKCSLVKAGYFVLYNIRSERLRVYASEGGQKLWDSEWLSGSEAPSIPGFVRARA